jgi:hypothetical protein
MTQWGLDTLFNPAKRHMDEEKRRLLSTREELGDSSGGKRVDLESGKVTISRTDVDENAEKKPKSRTGRPKKTSSQAEPSAAAKRAAERRRRKSD